MSIKLKYWLLRNKRSIKQFITDEKINSYEEVLTYCEKRGCDPISEEEYSKATETKISDQKKEAAVAETVPKAAKSKNVTKAKRTKRSTKAQTKRKPRTRKTQDRKQEGNTD